MTAELVIMDRKKVMVIHYFHQMCCSYLAHLALLVIKITHLLVEFSTPLHNCLKINNIVKVPLHAGDFTYQSFDLFIPEDRPYTTPSGLLHAHFFTLRIIKAEVEHPDKRVFRS